VRSLDLNTLFIIFPSLGEADRVVSDYLELMEASRGAVNAVVTIAEPLKKKEMESIEKAIRQIVGEEKQVDLTVEEDPDLLGGVQIRIGDQFMDLSVASRIAEMKRSLLDSDMG